MGRVERSSVRVIYEMRRNGMKSRKNIFMTESSRKNCAGLWERPRCQLGGNVTWTMYTNFRPPPTHTHFLKFSFDLPSGFKREVNIVDNDDDNERPSMGTCESKRSG